MERGFWEMTRVIEEALDSFDHQEISRMPDDQKVTAMTRIRALENRVRAAAAVVTDAVARSSATEHTTGTPLPDFLSTTEGRTAKDGLGQVFQASHLAGHPVVRDAALAGQVTPRHAEAIGTQLRRMPAEQMSPAQLDAAARAFLAQAPATTPGRLAGRADAILADVAPELAPSPEQSAALAERRRRRAVAGRRFSWWNDGDGSIRLSGQLPELEGMRLVPVLDAFVEAGRRAEHDEAENLRRRRTSGAITSRQYVAAHRELETRESRTGGQRMADALMSMIDVLADLEKVPAAGGETPRLVVTLDYQALRAEAGQLYEAGLIEGDLPVDAGQLRQLCCDAEVLPMVLGGSSEILDVGRAARLVTPALRKALRARDRGCIFPGCTAPSTVCQAHHVIPWWAGGPTALDNLVLVCRHHHSLVEPDRTGRRDQWSIEFHPDTHLPRAVPPARLGPHLPQSRPPGEDPGHSSAPSRSNVAGTGKAGRQEAAQRRRDRVA